MKYLFILFFIFLSSISYGQYEDVCLKIGYKKGSAKFVQCVLDLSSNKKTINTNTDIKLAPKANANALYGTMLLAPGANLAVGEIFGTSLAKVTAKEVIEKLEKRSSYYPKCSGSPKKGSISDHSKWHNCEGNFTYTNGDIYEGLFKNGTHDGVATYYYLAENKYKGDKHIGEYKNGKKHGRGIYYFLANNNSKGNIYIGEFKDSKINGQGNMTSSNGSKYIGEWKNGKPHGLGTYIYGEGQSAGDKYIGEHKDGKFHGQGKYFFANGDVVLGQFKNDNFSKVERYTAKEYKEFLVTKDNITQKNNQLTEKDSLKIPKVMKKEKNFVSNDNTPPLIVINSTKVNDKQGNIRGNVSDNIEVAELSINGELVIYDEKGNFAYSTFIPKKGKKLIIQATDSKGLSKKEIVFLERNELIIANQIAFTALNPLKLSGKSNKNALGLIIGISKYNNAPEAKYADRDANYFSDFAEGVLGIKKNNIKLISNNSANNFAIKKALKIWLKGYSEPNQSDIYIFFAGHGLASTDGKELYLLPYDGEPRLLEDTALLRSEIFETLQSINPKSVTVFLDACYSGQTREKDMILADARPIAIVPVESDVPDNFTVFSASSGSEISGSLPEAAHGLFSYFLMKGLEGDADANNDKKITNGELHNYVHSNVTRQAVRLGREQTPQLQGDENRVLVEFN